MTDTEALAAAGIIGAFMSIFIIIAIVWYVLQVIAYWRIFTKAGEAGWKSIIPFYNLYTQYKFSWEAKFFWIMLALWIIGLILSSVGGAISYLGTLCNLAMLVLIIIGNHKLSKAFGHGVGFTIGLIILNPIFLLILGFGSSEYQGKIEG